MPNITFQSLGEIPLKFWIGGAGLLSKLVCTWGMLLAKIKHLGSLWQGLCFLEERSLFCCVSNLKKNYEFLLFLFPGCLLWRLPDITSLTVSKTETSYSQSRVGSVIISYFLFVIISYFLPALFNGLNFKVKKKKNRQTNEKNKYSIGRVQRKKRKKNNVGTILQSQK